jgi:hypothetical protein
MYNHDSDAFSPCWAIVFAFVGILYDNDLRANHTTVYTPLGLSHVLWESC